MKPEEFIKQVNELVKKGKDSIDYSTNNLDDAYKVENYFTDLKELAEKFVAALPKAVYALVESPEPEDYQDNDPTIQLFFDQKKAQEELAKKAIAAIEYASEINVIHVDEEEPDREEAKELLNNGAEYFSMDEFGPEYWLRIKTLTIK
jgi:hypothetical protein